MTGTETGLKQGPIALREALWFGKTQFLACLFGILLLAGLMLTRYWVPQVELSRSDILFLYAILLQAALIAFRLEHRDEIVVIFAFHILATLMEWFKTSPEIGSWQYPGEGVIFRIYQVPMFAGFLYSAVGSYIARSWRLFEFRFVNYPPIWTTVVLAVLAYVNFFTHHFTLDIRWILIVASGVLFGRCQLIFRTGNASRRIPLLLGLSFVALAIWVAENVGTYARAWIYPNQEDGWELVSFHKFWAWYLLMILSFVLVSLVHFRRSGAPNAGAVEGEKDW